MLRVHYNNPRDLSHASWRCSNQSSTCWSPPKTIGSDNGTELTSNAILSRTADNQVDWHYIDPVKPVQNACIESFMYGRLLHSKVDSEGSASHGRARSCMRPVHTAHLHDRRP